MNPVALQAVEIEAILYEGAVESLVVLLDNRALQGSPRELQLVQTSSMLLEHMDTREKLASLAAMSLVLLHKERKKKNADRRQRSR
jgi:hypothetical protein